MNLLLFLLGVLVLYVPNQIHFPSSLGVPGLNVLNVLVLLTFFVYKIKTSEKVEVMPLKGPMIFLFIMVLYAFVIANIRKPLSFIDDIIYVKTAIFYPLLFFLFYSGLRTIKQVKVFYLILLAVAGLAALEAIREAIDYGIGNYNDSKRASGPFGADASSANRAGVFYSMFLPYFVGMAFFYKESKFIRWCAWGGVVATVAAIFFTYSRQSYFIAAVAILYLTLRRGGYAPLLFVLLALTYTWWVPEAAMERVSGTQQVTETGEEQLDESTESRLVLWAAAMDMIKDYPIGIGLNRFKSEIGNYSIYPNKDAHNHYILFATEGSVIALLSLLVLMAALFRIGLKVSRYGDPLSRMVGLSYTCSVVCMALGNVYGSPFSSGEVMGNFWIMSAVVARYYYLLENNLVTETVVESKKVDVHPVFG